MPGSLKTKRMPLSKADIPEAIRCQLDAVGGVEGLLRQLPAERSLRKASSAHRALSDPLRLTILHLLAIQPLCVCVLKACTGIADSRLSYHLTILRKAGLIEGAQQGNWIIYRLTDEGYAILEKTGPAKLAGGDPHVG